ncbi:MAG: NAD-dependent epimerase/dehydratase family protein [Pseudomonadota bacterium]
MRAIGQGSLVLVTGGAGFIGAWVVKELLARGYRVRVVDDLSRGRRERLDGMEVELMVEDVRSERVARECCAGATAIVHLAGPPPNPVGARDERRSHETNMTAIMQLGLAARAARPSRFVFASSAAVYGRQNALLLHEGLTPKPICAEGAQKLAAETYLRMFAARDGLPVVVLRLFTVYGPGQDGDCEEEAPCIARFVRQVAFGEPPVIHGDGSQTRDFVHCRDAARAIVAALMTPGTAGRTINVASGHSTSIRDVALLLADLANGLPPRFAPGKIREPYQVRASIAAMTATLGIRPKTRLCDGLLSCLEVAATSPGRPIAGSPVSLFKTRPPSWSIPDES